MKRIVFISIVILTSLRVYSIDIPEEIVTAFSSGNATLLAKYFNQTIELTLLDKEEVYSKTQAEIIMRDFFNSNPPKQFQIMHEGGKETSKYAIGTLTAESNKYRITFLLKSLDSKVYIHQLRIEYDNVQ